MRVREYKLEDANSLCELVMRMGFGSDASDARMTADTINSTLLERCMRLALVAVDDRDMIIGFLAMLRDSGRRTSEPDELYSDMYLVDPRHRNSMVGGKLFSEAFSRVLRMNIRALRTEASPTNTAFKLYTRVGFRMKPGALPDQRGYIELVSWLPGLIIDMSKIDPDIKDNPPGLRSLQGRRSTQAASGVTLVNGRWAAHYDFRLGDETLHAAIDMDTGKLLTISSPKFNALAGARLGAVTSRTHTVWRSEFGNDGWLVEVDSHGTMRITTPAGSPAVIERWPVIRGLDPPGWRSSTFAREAGGHDAGQPNGRFVQFERTEHGIRAAGHADGIERTYSIVDNQLEILTVTNRVTICSPWVQLRKSVWSIRVAGRWYSEPARQGSWPPSATDFQPAVRPVFGDRRDCCTDALSVSADGQSLVAQWSGAQARIEGLHFPQLTVEAGQESVLRISARRDAQRAAPRNEPTVDFGVAEPANHHCASHDHSGAEPSVCPREHVDGEHVLRLGRHEFVITPRSAVATWEIDGQKVLSSSWPHSTTLGPLEDCDAGMWAATVSSRHEPSTGVQWVGPDRSLPFGSSSPGWTLSSIGNDTISACVIGSRAADCQDFALCLTPCMDLEPQFVVVANGLLWDIADSGREWEGGFDAIGARLPFGKWLAVVPRAGMRLAHDTEVFVRSRCGKVILTCLAGPGEPLVVDMHVCDHTSLRTILGSSSSQYFGANARRRPTV